MSRQAKIIVGAIVGVVVLSIIVAVAVMGRQSSPKNAASSENTIRIEIRSMPRMDVKKDGKLLGKTPFSFAVRPSTQPITIETEWVEHRFYRAGDVKVPRHAKKTVVPDHAQTIDFTVKDADPVTVEPPSKSPIPPTE